MTRVGWRSRARRNLLGQGVASQLEVSAHAPCTSTTVGLIAPGAGAALKRAVAEVVGVCAGGELEVEQLVATSSSHGTMLITVTARIRVPDMRTFLSLSLNAQRDGVSRIEAKGFINEATKSCALQLQGEVTDN